MALNAMRDRSHTKDRQPCVTEVTQKTDRSHSDRAMRDTSHTKDRHVTQ